MGKTLQKMLQELPKARQAKVRARTAELIAEEMSLQDVRKARAQTQKKMAELLNIGQDSVSRIEKRSDLLLSTLTNYIAALGGRLTLIAEFPDRPPVALSGLAEDDEDVRKPVRVRPKAKKSGSHHAGV